MFWPTRFRKTFDAWDGVSGLRSWVTIYMILGSWVDSKEFDIRWCNLYLLFWITMGCKKCGIVPCQQVCMIHNNVKLDIPRWYRWCICFIALDLVWSWALLELSTPVSIPCQEGLPWLGQITRILVVVQAKSVHSKTDLATNTARMFRWGIWGNLISKFLTLCHIGLLLLAKISLIFSLLLLHRTMSLWFWFLVQYSLWW